MAATNYVFTFVNGTLTVNAAVAQITAPPKSTMLSGSTVNFTWSHETNAVSYQLLLGTTAGASNLADVTTANLSTLVNGLPTDGSLIYATLKGSTDGTHLHRPGHRPLRRQLRHQRDDRPHPGFDLHRQHRNLYLGDGLRNVGGMG